LAYADRARVALLQRDQTHAQRLVQVYAAAYQRLQPFVEALQERWIAESETGELTIEQMRSLDAYQSLLNQIEAEMTRYGQYVGQEMALDAAEAVTLAAEDARREIELSLDRLPEGTIQEIWRALPADAIETLLVMTEPGSPMRQAMDRELGPAVAEQVGERILEDVALGKNPRQAGARTADTLGTGLNWTLRTYRTAQLWSYRAAKHAAWSENPELYRGWVWRARLSDETCPACIAQHGTRHPPDEVMNDHHNGACTPVAITPTYQELLGLDEPIPGDVPSALTIGRGADWFATQPAELQRRILGDARYNAFEAGAIALQDLVRTHDDPVLGPIVVEGSLKNALGADEARQYYQTNTPGG
jgi:hypothetical protein